MHKSQCLIRYIIYSFCSNVYLSRIQNANTQCQLLKLAKTNRTTNDKFVIYVLPSNNIQISSNIQTMILQ